MPNTAQIDVADGEVPAGGERFVIALQENSELLGLLDRGRTFRFVAPTQAERDYQKENRPLTVVAFELLSVGRKESRLVGALTYMG